VGKDRNEEEIRKGTGVLAARLVDAYVKDGSILGISYGRSPASTVAALAPNRQVAITVVPIIGALGSDNFEIDGPELIRSLAQIYGGKYRYLPAPLLVKDTRTRDTLVQSGKIYDILALARKAHIALLGIGAPGSGVSSLIWGGYLNKRELALVSEQGAVGHMCGQFFDREGNLLDVELNHRVIGIGLKALQKIKTVIVAAGGEAKAAAILGALRGRYLNVLVTDDAAARKILALASSS
jgi:DNA-binding transcriptional regulator LsrR (DeoR family)